MGNSHSGSTMGACNLRQVDVEFLMQVAHPILPSSVCCGAQGVGNYSRVNSGWMCVEGHRRNHLEFQHLLIYASPRPFLDSICSGPPA